MIYICIYTGDNVVSVFKAANEEPGVNKGVNNPHDQTEPLRDNFVPGQGIIREYAAYLMDINNFSKVPKTKLEYLENHKFVYNDTSVAYPKYGALQEFVEGVVMGDEYGWNIF